MGKLVLKMSMSLDGFVAGPNRESDWIFRTMDEGSDAWEMEVIGRAGYHAMGSETYLDMASYWPWATNLFAQSMNTVPKLVFSHRQELARDAVKRSRAVEDENAKAKKPTPEPTEKVLDGWRNPRLVSGPLAEELRGLKEEPGGDIVLYGGAKIVQSVIATGLVDEYYFLVHPVALGRGLPIFTKLEKPADLELVESKAFKKGAVANHYRPKR